MKLVESMADSPWVCLVVVQEVTINGKFGNSSWPQLR